MGNCLKKIKTLICHLEMIQTLTDVEIVAFLLWTRKNEKIFVGVTSTSSTSLFRHTSFHYFHRVDTQILNAFSFRF